LPFEKLEPYDGKLSRTVLRGEWSGNAPDLPDQRGEMKDTLEIKWPWEMVYMECIEDFIDTIKKFLPPDHELQGHELFPGIKWDGRPIFIIDDDTTGECLLMDFEKTTRWKRSRRNVPTITVFRTREEVGNMIEQDHRAEMEKYNDNGNHR